MMEGGKRFKGFQLEDNYATISIITVVFNAADVLERTILSVANQSFKNVEHIILDGGSTDGTLEVLKKHNDVIAYWKSERDAGIYDAMNKAQSLASGNFLMFLNAGDEFVNLGTLAHCFSVCSPTTEVLYGDTVITDSAGKPLKLRQHRPPQNLKYTDLRYGMLVCHQSIIVRRNKSVNYNTDYKIAADIDWAIRTLKACSSIQNTHIAISSFMEGGMSTIHKRRGLTERYAILKKHFGTIPNLLAHAYMALRLLWYKFPFKAEGEKV